MNLVSDDAKSGFFDGKLRARFTLGVTTTDLEDVAVGRCPAGSCVFIADIGDNASVRASVAILRAPEPELGASPAPDAVPLPGLERFAFPHETMVSWTTAV